MHPYIYVSPDVCTGPSRIGLSMALEAMLDGRKPPCSCSDEKIGAIFCADRIVARDTAA